ncbi:MAG: hypothetical protein AAF682_08490 [Planctomycetota bacterium]
MSTSPARWLPWAAAAALYAGFLALGGAPADDAPEARVGGPARRLLGPFARLAAEIQWIRFDRARLQGRGELALAHAETALGLDPGDARGWELLAIHLALDLGTPELEPDPDRRRAWVSAGVAVAERGEKASRDPAALAFVQGYLLHVKLESDPALSWPGGAAAAWRETTAHYARAAELGYPRAEIAAGYAADRAAGYAGGADADG